MLESQVNKFASFDNITGARLRLNLAHSVLTNIERQQEQVKRKVQ